MIYGYARVSTRAQATDGNSLTAQRQALEEAGATSVFEETFTGSTTDRPELQKLLDVLTDGDTFIVTKLDRIARSARQGLELVDRLNAKNVRVQILNMGVIDNTPIGKLMRTMMFGFAEFERDMIFERTQEGRRIARLDENYRDGRPKKFSEEQIRHAMELLNGRTFRQVSQMTGISITTLKRNKKIYAVQQCTNIRNN